MVVLEFRWCIINVVLMKVRRAYKFKLYSSDKLAKVASVAGSCRFVWNQVLALNLERLEQGKPIMRYNEAAKLLPEWKRTEALGWLKSVNAQALQQKLRDLDRAFLDCFDKKQPNKRTPRFKKRGKSVDSFRIPTAPKLVDNKIYVPKIGWLRYFKSREIEGRPCNFTISRAVDGFYVSIQTEIEMPEQTEITPIKPVGIDLGVNQHATLSDGAIYRLPSMTELKAKKKRLQQELARRKKFGANWRKTKRKLGRLERKMARVRKDFLHKTSTEIVKNHDAVYVEDLEITKMTAKVVGTGAGVKRRLNRSILEQGWGEFRRQLEYKAHAANARYNQVPAPYTSQRCSSCDHVHPKNRTSQSTFKCTSCGLALNADHNAAINILRLGHEPSVLAC